MKKALATLSLGALMAVAVPGVANAQGGGGGVTVNGKCSAASTSTLKVKTDNSNLEVEFQVDENVVGQTWKVKISDNGVVVARATKTTTAPSGSFTVRRLIPNNAGTDLIKAAATNQATGEMCTASVSF
ncbi:MAG: hypothetical protein QOH10_1128 [Actinomycetota bacterium]|jgi:hypothetical protein|nr:hypothetical protein [Actinomycetota bacterium]